MQVGKVTRVLGAVCKMTKEGNRVVFDSDGSYIESKITKVRIPLEEVSGEYQFELWIPKPRGKVNNLGLTFQRLDTR